MWDEYKCNNWMSPCISLREVLLERKMKVSEYEISILDFKSTSSLCIRFPSDGSTDSRSSYTEVEWISYCPDVFRILQDYGKVDFDDYTASISTQLSGSLTKPDSAVDGIFGFKHDGLSVISQLSSAGVAPKVFSHCLKGSDNGGGILVLGEIIEPGIVYTPLVQSQSCPVF
ncbi:aspartic proteinase-like protein 2 [Iris pallida]|uniref:Aspartic proteinase-like protein 2 n=1 Tax=Iris pallida TaxID=29817 RepID=A0AAX6HHB4_IRIPA|nr:aspartic proteinase-like protein 2 [Iris pallida]